MYPYQWGAAPIGYPAGLTAGIMPLVTPGIDGLPEEVRAALEERQSEIHSEDEMRQLINELMLRR